ncbi:hypothetical protein [Streptomyces maremycinicus]|uniref:hypothetical protein n=1 Tax=Streptomyces maremycinicus TaxID=1679753 RepID=UPI0007876032|nr:hypothetical protein [Streptomyces sp. NBRC 110468]
MSATTNRRTIALTHREPPGFLGESVGAALGELQHRQSAWLVSRSISAPPFTRRLLAREPCFDTLAPTQLSAASQALTFRLGHVQRWRLLWVVSADGPGQFTDERTVRVGVTEETARELATTIGLEAKLDIPFLAAQASAQWSRLTRSTISVNTESEFTRTLSYDVPEGGLDIALWQLESQLLRRLELRAGAALPPDPMPRWVELAVTTRARSRVITVPTNVVRVLTRRAPGGGDGAAAGA